MTLQFRENIYNVSVTITCKVVYGTDWWDERKNHFRVESAEASETVYDIGPTVCHLSLVLKGVSKDHGDALRTWLKTNVLFGSTPFDIIQGSGSVDLGNGLGTMVEDAVLEDVGTLEGYFEFVAPGIYNINLPVKYRR